MSYTLQLNKNTTITAGITASDLSLTLSSAVFTNFTSDYLVIDYDNPTKLEVVKCAVTGTTVTISDRGQEGTSAVTHDAGAKIAYVFVPSHYSDLVTLATTTEADGWQGVAETWTYASGTTITVPAGNLTKRSVGDKIKLNQSIPLTAYWPMEDKDSDVGSFTVANIGTPTYTAGKFSNALTLNGTDQALAITDDALFKPTGAFTIGMWVKYTATGAAAGVFQSSYTNTQAGFDIYMSSTDKVVVDVGNGTTVTGITGATTIDANWHYIVVSYQSNHLKIFVDGVLDAMGYVPTPAYNASNKPRIGCLNSTGADGVFFKGQIDDLFFINGFAVDAAWVAAKYAEATAQTTANITATQYFYVTAVADELLTVTGGADYVLYNATISTPYYSKVASPVGFPQWFNTGNIVLNNTADNTALTKTTNVSKFTINGRLLTWILFFSTISNPGGNNIVVYLPVNRGQTVGGALGMLYGEALDGIITVLSSSTSAAKVSLWRAPSEAAWSTGGSASVRGEFSYEI